MNSCCVDSNSFFCGHVRSVFQIIVLALLLCLQPEASETAEILLHNCFIDSTTTLDSFTVVVRNIRPPIGLGLDVAKNHVFNWSRHAWHLPWDICLPAAECLAQMAENDPGLVLFHSRWHHIKNIMHDRGSQLEIKVRFNSLLCNILCKRL